MDKARNTQAYIDGVKKFIDFAFTHSARGNTISCPCRNYLMVLEHDHHRASSRAMYLIAIHNHLEVEKSMAKAVMRPQAS